MRQTHHDGILDETVHETYPHTPVAGARCATREQTAADPPALTLRQYRNAQLRMSILASEVGRANNREIDVSRDKDSVALEVDTFHIMPSAVVRQRVREPEAAIFPRQARADG